MRIYASRPFVLATAVVVALAPSPAPAQQRATAAAPAGPGGADPSLFRAPMLDPLTLVMAYNRLNGTGMDFRPYAERSTAYVNATAFDRPQVLAREISRLEGQLATLDLGRTYLMRIGTQLRQYDASLGGYAVGLNPEAYVPVADPVNYHAFGVQFRNLEEVDTLRVGDATAARNFAQRNGLSTQFDVAGDVVAEFVIRLVEAPPAVSGGVTIVRADITAARVLTRNGQMVWDFGQTGAGRRPTTQSTAFSAPPTLKAVDVQGLRVGMPLAEGSGVASRAYPTKRYDDTRGGRWFRDISPQAEASASGIHADTAIRCGLDPVSMAEEMMGRQMGESGGAVANTSDACLGFDAGDGIAVPREGVGRVTSGQRVAGASVEAVRQALVEKYGPVTYTRNAGRELQWIGRDPAQSNGVPVSVTARIEPLKSGGVVMGIEVVPYVDPNPARPATPSAVPAAPRL